MIKEFNLYSSKGNKLRTSCFCEENIFSGRALVFVHGFKGFKDWGFGHYLGEYFSKRGFFTITFNFSHNGVGDDLFEFIELDKFARNTISLEISELNDIINFLKNGFFGIEISKKIAILGHSRGGAVSLLTAAGRNDVGAVAAWASISKFDRYSNRQKTEWRKKGYFEIVNARTKQKMRLNVELLDDIEKNSACSLNQENALKNLNCPLFIAHGDQDLAVPIAEGEQIYSWADKTRTEFYKVYGTGHTFDIVHPFNGSNEKFEKLLNKTAHFFEKNIN
ncbi:MAG TPA: prolyl oligopeptidase family serine peptidase [Melioribacteraceae bacterium]|nr:prolyl oligopeptidase family serine peptidase [Melioribacteraceae bacterium]